MATNSGTTVLHVVSTSRLKYSYDREAQVNKAIQQLSNEGKRVVNIVDGPIAPFGPLGNVYSDVTIIWERIQENTVTTPAVIVENPKNEEKVSVIVTSENFNSILSRIDLFLEDGEWEKAKGYCDAALDFNSTNAEVYLRLLLAELKVSRREELAHCEQPFDGNSNYKKAMRFGSDELKAELSGYISNINEFNETKRLTGIYNNAITAMNAANSESAYKAAAATFRTIPSFKDADSLAEQCLERAEVCRKDAIYSSARSQMTGTALSGYEAAIKTFRTISGWKDADEQICACQRKIEEIKAKEEADRLERERQAEQERIAAEIAAKKRKKTIAIVTPIVAACLVFAILLTTVIIPNSKYNAAIKLFENGQYDDAITAFEAMNGYKDSEEKIESCKLQIALKMMDSGDYESAFMLIEDNKDSESASSSLYDRASAMVESGKYDDAIRLFTFIDSYRDSAERIIDSKYKKANDLFSDGKYDKAAQLFTEISSYNDSESRAAAANYLYASDLFEQGQYNEAESVFTALGEYDDSSVKAKECRYQQATALLGKGSFDSAIELFVSLGDYNNSAELIKECNYQAARSVWNGLNKSNANKENVELMLGYLAKVRGYNDDVETMYESVKKVVVSASSDGANYTYTYNVYGSLTSIRMSGSESYTNYTFDYDNEGRLIKSKSVNQYGYTRTRTLKYLNGVLNSIEHSDSGYRYKVDSNGNVVKMTYTSEYSGKSSDYVYKYDSNNRLIKEIDPDDGVYGHSEYSFEYNSNGQLVTITMTYIYGKNMSEPGKVIPCYTETFKYSNGVLSSKDRVYPNNSFYDKKRGQTETTTYTWGYIIATKTNNTATIIDVTDHYVYPQY